MKICPFCKNEFNEGKSFGAHITNCKENPKRKSIIEKIRGSKRHFIQKYELKCKKCDDSYFLEISEINFKKGNYRKFCSRKCANSSWERSKEVKEKIRKKLTGVYRGGKKYFCKKCDKPLINKRKYGYCINCVRKSDEYKINISNSLKGKTGGYRDKGGIGKQGWYKGIYCNSSWELAFVIYNFDHNIHLIRNKKGFEYIYEGKQFKYYPDFIIDEKYFEVKGYLDKKGKIKIKSFPLELKIIGKNEIQLYLNYVTEKYGNDFINLYE